MGDQLPNFRADGSPKVEKEPLGRREHGGEVSETSPS